MSEGFLTPKQKQMLEWIHHFLGVNQTMPSRREIGLGLGLSSPATIQQHIEALEKKGFLKRGDTREVRALQWTAKSKKLFSQIEAHSIEKSKEGMESNSSTAVEIDSIPLLGSIAAGYPIEVYPDTKHVSVPLELFISPKQAHLSKKDVYMLTVRGDSMINEGIHPNDWVILKKATQAKPGETIAALLNGEATLKKFYKTKSGVELHPANPKYPVISISGEDRFEIQGVLIGVIRRFLT